MTTVTAPDRAPLSQPTPPSGAEAAKSPRAPARERLVSLDVFRGLTIAGMLLVNDPGSWSHIYAPLEHAPWNGWTPTDLIFPFFLFIVGITTHLSLASRRARGDGARAIVRQVVRRGALIVLIGLLLNLFPFVPLDVRLGPLHLGWPVERIVHFRVPGVLQRIGVAYTAAALLTLRTSAKQQLLIAAALLFGYWFAMTLLPVPDTGALGALTLDSPPHTLAAWLDRAVFGSHVWAQTATWDPEGLLSTLPAIGTAMLGVLAGRWIAAPRPLVERIAGLFAAGSLAMVAGLMWNWSFPINKNLWTSSFVLFTAGMACVTLATCMWLIEEMRLTRWTKPFVIFGVNPIVAFIGAGVVGRLIQSIITVTVSGKELTLQEAAYEGLLALGLDPLNASLLFALIFVLVSLGALSMLHRRNIILKV